MNVRHTQQSSCLFKHNVWLRRADFLSAATQYSPDENMCTIRWSAARELLDSRDLYGSTTELAILDFATALGENRYKLPNMGRVNAQSIMDATYTALMGEAVKHSAMVDAKFNKTKSNQD